MKKYILLICTLFAFASCDKLELLEPLEFGEVTFYIYTEFEADKVEIHVDNNRRFFTNIENGRGFISVSTKLLTGPYTIKRVNVFNEDGSFERLLARHIPIYIQPGKNKIPLIQ